MTRIIRRRTALALGLAAGALAASMLARHSEARSISGTGKSMRMVVPFAAGGTTDLLARIVGQILAEATTSTCVVDNRPGDGGNVSAEIVARAAPDGMTLLLGTLSTAVTNQYLYKYLPYDIEGSFAPVALVGEVANVLVVHPSFAAKTLEDFVAYCKWQGPNNVTYSSPGVGSSGHLSMEYLQILTGIKLAHIVYRSRAAMTKALLAGHVPIAMDNVPPYLRYLQSGALSALGVSSSKRWFAAPDLPTIAEQGYADFEAAHWWYVAAPAGTRPEIVTRLSDEIVKGIKCESTIKKIHDAGASELPGNADDLARHIAAENKKWKHVIGAAHIQPQ